MTLVKPVLRSCVGYHIPGMPTIPQLNGFTRRIAYNEVFLRAYGCPAYIFVAWGWSLHLTTHSTYETDVFSIYTFASNILLPIYHLIKNLIKTWIVGPNSV